MNPEQPIAPISINHELKAHAAKLKIDRDEQKPKTIEQMDKLLEIHLSIAAIIEKSQRFHKQDLFGFWGDVFTPQEVKDSMRLKRMNAKRHYRTCKLQQEILGFVERRDQEERDYEWGTAVKPSALSYMLKISRSLCKKVEDRPVSTWSDNEVERFKAIAKPLNKIMEEIESRGINQ